MRTQEVDVGEIGKISGVNDVSLYMITNLDYVTVHDVRTMTNALILSPKGERARGSASARRCRRLTSRRLRSMR